MKTNFTLGIGMIGTLALTIGIGAWFVSDNFNLAHLLFCILGTYAVTMAFNLSASN